MNNQQIKDSFILGLPFYKLKKDNHLSKLLSLLQFTLYFVIHFVQLFNTLSCSPITFAQVLQI